MPDVPRLREAQPPEHRPVVLLTVLPRERRSRHPYQLCMMLALVTLGVSQLVLGPAPNAAIKVLSDSDQAQLNWFCVIAGLGGMAAAVIPEHIIRWRLRREYSFDATWARLCVEAGCHGALFFVWMSYLVAILTVFPFSQGLSLGSGLVFWLAFAAGWRCAQILWTVKRAVIDPRIPSGIIGISEIGRQ